MDEMQATARAEWQRHWPLVIATAAGMALAGMLSAVFGVMLEPMQQDLGWTRAEISTGPVVVSLMGLVLAAPAGWLIDRWGSRVTGVIVVATTFCAIVAMSQVGHALWHWWAAWSIFGIAGAFTSTVWMAPVSTLFDKGRGMAIAVTLSGASVTAAAAPVIAEYFVAHHGWRVAFLALAVIWCGLTLPLVLAFVPGRRPPASTTPEARPGQASPPTFERGGYTAREGLASRGFWMIFMASFISGLTGLALVLNLVPVLTYTGLTRAEAVAVAGVTGLASLAGRMFGGWLMDNFEVRRLAILAGICSTFFPLTLIVAPGVMWAAMAALVFHGLTGGLRMSAVVYLTSSYLGARSFGLFYGAISTTTTVAMGVGPLIANYIFDQTQSYAPTIWAAVPGFLASSLLFATLGPAPDFAHPARRAEGKS